MKASAIWSYLVQPILAIITGLIEASNLTSATNDLMVIGIVFGAIVDLCLAIHSAKKYKGSCVISIIWNIFLLWLNFSWGIMFFGMFGM